MRRAEAAWGGRGGPIPGVGPGEGGLLLVRGLEVLDQVQDAPALVVRDAHQPLREHLSQLMPGTLL